MFRNLTHDYVNLTTCGFISLGPFCRPDSKLVAWVNSVLVESFARIESQYFSRATFIVLLNIVRKTQFCSVLDHSNLVIKSSSEYIAEKMSVMDVE